jgi:putative acetyltransferase
MSLVIERIATPTDDARRLIEELDAELNGAYTPEQRHGLNFAAIFRPGLHFFVARVDGEPAGCGGVAIESDFAEVKRMYVRPQFRGTGASQAILSRLESEAANRGIARMTLETGDAQLAAMRFYERAGYYRCRPFGDYATMPPASIIRSVFFEKSLPPKDQRCVTQS